MSDSAGEKTFEPTTYRRQQARQEGHVAFSHDLASAVMWVIGVLLLAMMGGKLVEFVAAVFQRQLSQASLTIDADAVVHQWRGIAGALAMVTLPLLALLVLAGVLTSVLQTGFLWVPGRVVPDFGRLSPSRGLARIFSLRSGSRFGLGLLKIVVVTAVACAIVSSRWQQFIHSSAIPLADLARMIVDTLLATALWIGVALVILAVLDYGFQRWKYEQDLKMTRQEAIEEARIVEGDPQVAARFRDLRRKLRSL